MLQQYVYAGWRIIPLLCLMLALGPLRAQEQAGAPASPFTVGGYGEAHVNVTEGAGGDSFDIHRFVIYMGYAFADWITLHSETELEHAFVLDNNGEISLEQLYVDFAINEHANVRAGRVLTPVGIINMRHEPTTFYGVERPAVDTVIIPTTWSSDGVGVYGDITPNVSYEAYLANGLDGSKFTALDGIRKGRIKERPGLTDLAVTGRLDWRPQALAAQELRVGVSAFTGGANNGNRGAVPNVKASVTVYAVDAQARVGKVDLRGIYAIDRVHGAKNIAGVAEELRGWYVEGGWHIWPEGWKTGKLADADAVLFARYDAYDTQARMPAGVAKNAAGDRTDVTVGLSFYPVSNLVAKADYQITKNGVGVKTNKINLGLGWQF
jgi:hypothetical protein